MLTLVICEDDILAQSLKEDSRSNNEGDEEFSFDNKIPDNNNESEAKSQDSTVQGKRCLSLRTACCFCCYLDSLEVWKTVTAGTKR